MLISVHLELIFHERVRLTCITEQHVCVLCYEQQICFHEQVIYAQINVFRIFISDNVCLDHELLIFFKKIQK